MEVVNESGAKIVIEGGRAKTDDPVEYTLRNDVLKVVSPSGGSANQNCFGVVGNNIRMSGGVIGNVVGSGNAISGGGSVAMVNFGGGGMTINGVDVHAKLRAANISTSRVNMINGKVFADGRDVTEVVFGKTSSSAPKGKKLNVAIEKDVESIAVSLSSTVEIRDRVAPVLTCSAKTSGMILVRSGVPLKKVKAKSTTSGIITFGSTKIERALFKTSTSARVDGGVILDDGELEASTSSSIRTTALAEATVSKEESTLAHISVARTAREDRGKRKSSSDGSDDEKPRKKKKKTKTKTKTTKKKGEDVVGGVGNVFSVSF